MIRWATLVAKTPDWVELKLTQSGHCSGCTGQCNRPLFKLFSFQDNHFKLFNNDGTVQLINSDILFKEDAKGRQVGQQVGLEVNTDFMLNGGFQLYILPLLWIMLFMVGGHFLALKLMLPTDLLTMFGLVLALLFIFLKQRNSDRLYSPKCLPKVTIL